MPNPNELARLEEELEYWKAELHHPTKYVSKAAREAVLHEIRLVERQLGIASKPYNSDN